MPQSQQGRLRRSAVFELSGAADPSEPVPVQVELAYEAHDPYAVQTSFRCGRGDWVVWVFSRDLLSRGIVAAAGEGDIRIQPVDNRTVELELCSPDGHVHVLAPRSTLQEFLRRTHELVAAGTEGDWLDLDHTVRALLSGDLG